MESEQIPGFNHALIDVSKGQLEELEHVESVYGCIADEDFFNNIPEINQRVQNIAEVSNQNFSAGLMDKTSILKRTRLLNESDQISYEVFVKINNTQTRSSVPSGMKTVDRRKITDQKVAMRYEYEHAKFWNEVGLPVPKVFAGIIDDNDHAAIISEFLDQDTLQIDMLALSEKISDLSRYGNNGHTQKDLNTLNEQTNAIILAAADTIGDFALDGGSLYIEKRRTNSCCPTMIQRKPEYFALKTKSHLERIIKESKKTIDREKVFGLFDTLIEPLINYNLITSPFRAVYGQHDEYFNNMSVQNVNGGFVVKFFDAENASYGPWWHSMAKLLFAPELALPNDRIEELFFTAHKTMVERIYEGQYASLAGTTLTDGQTSTQYLEDYTNYSEQLIRFDLARVHEIINTVGKRIRDSYSEKYDEMIQSEGTRGDAITRGRPMPYNHMRSAIAYPTYSRA
ncbi:hypothetical protein CL622_03475, partial [archaeon]|nr:hypothetical protein [archaeon]